MAVLLDRKVFITQLDGKSLYRMGWTTEYPEAMRIWPGTHSIGVRYLHSSMGGPVVNYANALLTLDAKAESKYIVRKLIVGGSIRFWIEDMDTGEVVGSELPVQASAGP
ncbi:hypothetical protein [Lysobacter sp. P5_B9]